MRYVAQFDDPFDTWIIMSGDQVQGLNYCIMLITYADYCSVVSSR